MITTSKPANIDYGLHWVCISEQSPTQLQHVKESSLAEYGIVTSVQEG